MTELLLVCDTIFCTTNNNNDVRTVLAKRNLLPSLSFLKKSKKK